MRGVGMMVIGEQKHGDYGEHRELNAQIEAEARKGDISLDEAVYQEARKDPYKPILFRRQTWMRLWRFLPVIWAVMK